MGEKREKKEEGGEERPRLPPRGLAGFVARHKHHKKGEFRPNCGVWPQSRGALGTHLAVNSLCPQPLKAPAINGGRGGENPEEKKEKNGTGETERGKKIDTLFLK